MATVSVQTILQSALPPGPSGFSGFSGISGFSGFSGTGAATITNDVSTNATYYPLAASSTTGSLTTVYTASPDFSYNPSTGIFTYGANTIVQFNSYRESSLSPTITTNTLTIDLYQATLFTVSLNNNINTLTVSNVATSTNVSSFTLVFTMDGTARTVSWPASFKWPGGTAPTLTSTNGKRDVFTFFTSDGGTNWFAFISGQNL